MKGFNPFQEASNESSLPEALTMAIKKTSKKDLNTKLKGFLEIFNWIETKSSLDEIICFREEFVQVLIS